MTLRPGAKPLLMSAPMVRATLAGMKTQTRRVAKFIPRELGLNFGFSGLVAGDYSTGDPTSGTVLRSRRGDGCWEDRTFALRCPFGAPGDQLWVRETWALLTGNGHRIVYRADADPPMTCGGTEPVRNMKWTPSIYLQRHHSRLTLEITSVRVERLQAISEEDARAEGVPARPAVHSICPCKTGVHDPGPHIATCPWRDDTYDPCGIHAIDAFAILWNSINGKRGQGRPFAWASNPWVWVIAFRRVDFASAAGEST